MIYELPKHETAIDLSKVTTISRVKHIPGDTDIRWWKYILTIGMYFPRHEVRPHVRIDPDRHYTIHYEYDTDKETKKVYDDLVKAWKGE